MKIITVGRAGLLATVALFAASCGGSSSESGLVSSAEAPSSTDAAATESSTTTAAAETTEATSEESTTAPEETTTTAASGEASDPFGDMSDDERAAVLAEMGLTEDELAQFELLLDSDAGRQIMAQGIVEATGITTDQALCIVENGDILGLMIGVTGGTSEPDNEVTASFLRTLDTCDIPLSAFGG